MAYKEVDLDTKISVFKDFISGMKVTDIADKYGVSRESVYTWSKTALKAAKEALVPYQRDETKRLKAEIKKLKAEYQKVSEDYRSLSQKTHFSASTSPSDKIRPTRCPKCNSTHVVKNGTYKTKEGIKQRYRCKDCNSKIFLVKKNSN